MKTKYKVMLWQTPKDIPAAMARLKSWGNVELNVKVADGPVTNYPALKVIEAAKAYGIPVSGWHYVYGDYPDLEARALEAALSLGIKRIDINAEGHYKMATRSDRERMYTEKLREMGASELSLCSYRYPHLHREIRWAVWDSLVDLYTPQVYWIGSQDGKGNVQATWESYRQFTQRPLEPVLPMFYEHSWKPSHESILEAVKASKSAGAQAMQFYRYGHIIEQGYEELLKTVVASPFEPGDVLPPITMEKPQYIESLVQGLRIRTGPGTDFPVVGALDLGERTLAHRFKSQPNKSTWARIDNDLWVAVYHPNWIGSIKQYAAIL